MSGDTKNILGGEENNGIIENQTVGDTGGDQGTGGTDSTGINRGSDQVFDYSKMIGDGGGLSENWRQGLPEDIRNEKCLDSIKTIGTLVKSFVSAQKMVGANKITLPGENATEEERNAFFNAIGRPETADGYSYEGVELPKGVVIDDDTMKEFRSFAHKNGLTQDAFKAAVAFDVERCRKIAEAEAAEANREYEETLGKLQQDYGANLNTVIAQCNKALETFGLKQLFEDKGLLSNYTMIKALATIGGKISESRLVSADLTPKGNDPQSRLNEIMADRNGAYYHRDHPGHDAAVSEVNQLLKQLAGQKKS